ncbi:type VI secretion system-associated FHA domain protein TagH [Marinobacteraceae bacterium S3BR75-40.1]
MHLELRIASYQRLSPSVTCNHRVHPRQATVIGRSPDCDWHLPDPNKILSSRHAEIRFDGGVFLIRDLSTNGVYLNEASAPLGKGNEAGIDDGDRLRLGDYEITVAVSPGDDEAEAASRVQNESIAQPMGESGGAIPEGIGLQTLAEKPEWSTGAQAEKDIPDVLPAGLGERLMADTHVPIQEPSIPEAWHWGEAAGQEPAPSDTPVSSPRASAGQAELKALWEGLGLSQERGAGLGSGFYRELGGLTRVLLDRLLDLLHARAQQKQQLRVAQTLFQRSENNPLKFSATAQDALDSLLLRPHAANLGVQEAVNHAFNDIMSHERALMKGVEAVVADILDDGNAAHQKRWFSQRKTLATIRRHRAWQREAYGDAERMLRSEAFIEAYEKETGFKEGNPE